MENIAEKLIDYYEYELKNHYNSTVIRKNQIDMALQVLSFLLPSNPQKYLLIEAPVGTGKSLGALIPLMLYQEKNPLFQHFRVVYATSTINLQGQLNKGELPTLKKLGLLNQYIYAKGKAHYFCFKQLNQNSVTCLDLQDYKIDLQSFFQTSQTGHRDEFEEEYSPIKDELWEYVSLQSSRQNCFDCSYMSTCPTYKHRSFFRIPENEVVLTNHDQLIRSVLNIFETSIEIIPTRPGIIVIDEAHDFLENFLGQLEKKFSIYNLQKIAGKIPRKLVSEYRKNLDALINIINTDIAKKNGLGGRYPLSDLLIHILNKIEPIIKQSMLISVARKMNQNPNKKGFDRDKDIEDIHEIILAILNDQYVKWIDYEEKTFSAISKKFLAEFKELMDYLSKHNKIIMMSGTLTDNGCFDTIIQQWGMNKHDIQTLNVPNSFQLEKQALIYLPAQSQLIKFNGDYDNETYMDNQVYHIKNLLDITGGRTLILATSKKYIDELYNKLSPYTQLKGIKLLKQGSASVDQLTKIFKKDETSVLIGTRSFFSGISIKGKSLISVIITKLPYAPKDDPYLKLIGENFAVNEFRAKVLEADMMIKLKQQVGRLIRDIQDFGTITILDPRFLAKPISDYFKAIGYQITDDITVISCFIEKCMNFGVSLEYPFFDRNDLQIPNDLQQVIVESKVVKIPPRNQPSSVIYQRSVVKRQKCKKFNISDLPEEEQQYYKAKYNISSNKK